MAGGGLTVRKFSRIEHGMVPDVARGRWLAFMPSMHVANAVVRSLRSVVSMMSTEFRKIASMEDAGFATRTLNAVAFSDARHDSPGTACLASVQNHAAEDSRHK